MVNINILINEAEYKKLIEENILLPLSPMKCRKYQNSETMVFTLATVTEETFSFLILKYGKMNVWSRDNTDYSPSL